MKSIRTLPLALVISVAALFHSVVFAAERKSPVATELPSGVEISNADQIDSGLVKTDKSHGLDKNKAVSLETGSSLPVLDIHVGGEVSVSENNIVKVPWSSKSFESNGKVQLVQYIAANKGAARQNKPFTDMLKEKHYSSEQLTTTVIVNMADTMGLVKGIVVKKIAKNKVKHESINFVIDDNGVGLQRWGMKHKSYAVIVLDADGKVLFAKDGPLSETEIESTIKLIETHIS
jgi:YtfJ family uncharacterized protein